MSVLFQINWQQVFFPQISPVELILRGSLVYLVLVMILRFMPSRQVGGVGISDLLVVVLVATAVQDAMATNDSSITGGVIIVTTIIGWSYLFNLLSYKFPSLQRFLNPSPLLLVKKGQEFPQNMERGLITKRELMSQLRQQGVHSLNEVDRAYIEGDGRISIFTMDSKKSGRQESADSISPRKTADEEEDANGDSQQSAYDNSSAELPSGKDEEEDAANGDGQRPAHGERTHT